MRLSCTVPSGRPTRDRAQSLIAKERRPPSQSRFLPARGCILARSELRMASIARRDIDVLTFVVLDYPQGLPCELFLHEPLHRDGGVHDRYLLRSLHFLISLVESQPLDGLLIESAISLASLTSLGLTFRSLNSSSFDGLLYRPPNGLAPVDAGESP